MHHMVLASNFDSGRGSDLYYLQYCFPGDMAGFGGHLWPMDLAMPPGSPLGSAPSVASRVRREQTVGVLIRVRPLLRVEIHSAY